jgi:hypothetical protein
MHSTHPAAGMNSSSTPLQEAEWKSPIYQLQTSSDGNDSENEDSVSLATSGQKHLLLLNNNNNIVSWFLCLQGYMFKMFLVQNYF